LDRPIFYCRQLKQGGVVLEGDDVHHLLHVLRLKRGDNVKVFDGLGAYADATVAEVTRKGALLSVDVVQKASCRQSGRVIIATSLAKGQRFDRLISKCTEIGVDHIACVLFARTVKLAAGDKAVERYMKLAISAAKQSGGLFLPAIDAPAGLEESLEALMKRYPEAKIVFGGFGEGAVRASEWDSGGADVIAVIGPEGGMTEGEEQLLRGRGAVEVRLVENVLRVETAAVAFAAVLCCRR
jgi:16S rRNA (uracil1498-N3)-methyltransferase